MEQGSGGTGPSESRMRHSKDFLIIIWIPGGGGVRSFTHAVTFSSPSLSHALWNFYHFTKLVPECWSVIVNEIPCRDSTHKSRVVTSRWCWENFMCLLGSFISQEPLQHSSCSAVMAKKPRFGSWVKGSTTVTFAETPWMYLGNANLLQIPVILTSLPFHCCPIWASLSYLKLRAELRSTPQPSGDGRCFIKASSGKKTT